MTTLRHRKLMSRRGYRKDAGGNTDRKKGRNSLGAFRGLKIEG